MLTAVIIWWANAQRMMTVRFRNLRFVLLRSTFRRPGLLGAALLCAVLVGVTGPNLLGWSVTRLALLVLGVFAALGLLSVLYLLLPVPYCRALISLGNFPRRAVGILGDYRTEAGEIYYLEERLRWLDPIPPEVEEELQNRARRAQAALSLR